MKKMKLLFVLTFAALCIAYTSCQLNVIAREPNITGEPQNAEITFDYGEKSRAISGVSVTANSPDGGTLLYQWYSYTTTAEYRNQTGTKLDGQTKAALTHTLEWPDNAGANRYYVMVSNTKGGNTSPAVQSRGVTVTLNAEGYAVFPVITEQPQDATVSKSSTAIGLVSMLVTATISDSGTLSYQWYDNNSDSNEGGNAIAGATGSAYTPDFTVETPNETYYYYVEVTNTHPDTGDTSTTTSDPASYTVRDEPSSQDNTVTVNIAQKFQYVRGFGGSSIIWENFPNDNVEQMELMHGNGPGQLGLNLLRLMIPPDYIDIDYTMQKLFDDSIQDSDGNWRYSGTWWYDNRGESPPKNIEVPINQDGRNGKSNDDYCDIAAVVNKHGGYVLASPWSPPGPWKSNGHFNDRQGGDVWLLDQHYGDFANYLKRFAEIVGNPDNVMDPALKPYAGVYTVSLQNEHTYSTNGGYEGCQWNATRHTDFFRQVGHYMSSNAGIQLSTPDLPPPGPGIHPQNRTTGGAGPLAQSRNNSTRAAEVVPGFGGGRVIPSVRVMSGEAHNGIEGTGDLMCLIEDTVRGNEARRGVDILGRHIYGSTSVASQNFLDRAQFHATDPKEVWQTEWSTGGNPPETVATWNRVWEMMNAVDYNIRLNNENGFIWFPSVSFHAFLGDSENGTIYGQILPRGYGMSHWAKYGKETGRVGVTVAGRNTNANPSTFRGMTKTASEYLAPKIIAFVTLTDEFYEGPVESRHRRYRGVADETDPSAVTIGNLSVNDIQAISLVMFTPTNDSGASGTDMGTVKIQLPAGFVIGRTSAIRSTNGNYHVPESVTVGADRNSAFVTLPANNFLSVRFYKEQ